MALQNEQILTDADLAALEPRKYVTLERTMPSGKKTVKVLTNRILAVHGGAVAPEEAAQFSAELHNRNGKPTRAVFNGTTTSLFAQFNELGLRKKFLAFTEIQSTLTQMKEAAMQESAVRIALINSVMRPPGYRTSHGYKVKSVIRRLDTQAPLHAAQEVQELGQRLIEQGYKAAPGSGTQGFMLHPDQAGLTDTQGRRLIPVKAPRRKTTSTQRTLI